MILMLLGQLYSLKRLWHRSLYGRPGGHRMSACVYESETTRQLQTTEGGRGGGCKNKRNQGLVGVVSAYSL